jgi:hypothetical protein
VGQAPLAAPLALPVIIIIDDIKLCSGLLVPQGSFINEVLAEIISPKHAALSFSYPDNKTEAHGHRGTHKRAYD